VERGGKEHFIGLEWLRFLLGLYIVIFHTLHTYKLKEKVPWLMDMVGVGFFATSSFFVLSGFLLAHVYCRNGELREAATSFWAKRFSNLYPLHIFSLLLTFTVLTIISYLGIPPDDVKATVRFVVYDTNVDLGEAGRASIEHYMSNGELLLNSFLQVFMLQAWNPFYLTFNAPLWSISTLFFFYLTFPFAAPYLMRVKHKVLWIAALMLIYLIPPLLVIWNGDYGMPFTGMLHRMPIIRIPEFFAGIVGYALFRQMRDSGREPTPIIRILMIMFVLLCFFGAIWLLKSERYWYFLLHNGLLLPAQLMLIYLCALAGTPRSEWFNNWSRRLGAASLPLFVLHVPAFILFSRSEKIFNVMSIECLQDWNSCAVLASEQTLSIWFYPLFLLLTIILCIWSMERAVVPTRKWILKRLPLEATKQS
jgi:peptidoglycan/LPS O-acetylase OafA/YrhL